MTSSNEFIFNQVNEMISRGQGLSLLQKLEFDFSINSKDELGNYIFILQILLEEPNFMAEAINLLLKKVVLNIEKFPFLENKIESVFDLLFQNRAYPYVGLSELIRRLISTIIYDKGEDSDIISKIPSKAYLTNFNIILLQEFLTIDSCVIDKGITLLYNCWENVDAERKIHLSLKARQYFKLNLVEQPLAFDNYLKLFIRFQWYGGTRDWGEGKFIVPEPFYLDIFLTYNKFIDLLENNRHNLNRMMTDDIMRLHDDIKRFVSFYKNVKTGIEYDNKDLNLRIELHSRLVAELNSK